MTARIEGMMSKLERAMQHFMVEYHIFRNGHISSDDAVFYGELSEYLGECLEELYLNDHQGGTKNEH